MSNRVDFPMFELVGPPCEVSGCSGVLVDYTSLKTADIWKQCSKCNAEFYRMTGQEFLDSFKRLCKRILKGEEVS